MNPKIQFQFPVESVSRKLTLRKNTASTIRSGKPTEMTIEAQKTKEVQKFMGAGVRTFVRHGLGTEKKNYLFIRFNARGTQFSADELLMQGYFGNAAKMAKRWINDLVTLPKIQAAWNGNLSRSNVSPYGYSGQRSWAFAVAYNVLSNGGSINDPWPES